MASGVEMPRFMVRAISLTFKTIVMMIAFGFLQRY